MISGFLGMHPAGRRCSPALLAAVSLPPCDSRKEKMSREVDLAVIIITYVPLLTACLGGSRVRSTELRADLPSGSCLASHRLPYPGTHYGAKTPGDPLRSAEVRKGDTHRRAGHALWPLAVVCGALGLVRRSEAERSRPAQREKEKQSVWSTRHAALLALARSRGRWALCMLCTTCSFWITEMWTCGLSIDRAARRASNRSESLHGPEGRASNRL